MQNNQKNNLSQKFICLLKVNESRYITLFVFSGSIKKFFSTDCINIYLFSIFFSIDFARWKNLLSIACVNFILSRYFFFNRFCPVEKCGVTPHCLYRGSVTLKSNVHDIIDQKDNTDRR